MFMVFCGLGPEWFLSGLYKVLWPFKALSGVPRGSATIL